MDMYVALPRNVYARGNTIKARNSGVSAAKLKRRT